MAGTTWPWRWKGAPAWRFVVEEMVQAGVEHDLAAPADTATLRGHQKRAKTDAATRACNESCWRLVDCWSLGSHRPQGVLEVRTLGRLYVALMDGRRAWQQGIHAQLFHQGVPPVGGLLTAGGCTAPAGDIQGNNNVSVCRAILCKV